MNVLPVITPKDAAWATDESRLALAEMLPKPKEGMIWKFKAYPQLGLPLRFANAEDAAKWGASQRPDGTFAESPNFVLPHLKKDGAWKPNPAYAEAPFEVVFFFEEPA